MSEPRRITERYRLERRISSRDASSVFQAVDALSGATVAVKLVNPGESAELRASFEAHLASLQSVQHPSLPRILDFGLTPAGSAFVVTEFLPGEDLGQLDDAPAERVLALLLQLAEGLEALAARGIVVRSLSPENLRVVPGPEGERVKILGLGGETLRPGDAGANGAHDNLRAFAELAVRTLHLPVQLRQDESISLPLHVASSLAEPERLRELLDASLHNDPGGQFPDWTEVRWALRAALFGETDRQPAAHPFPTPPPIPPRVPPATMPAPPAPAAAPPPPTPSGPGWKEVRLGQGAPPLLGVDDPGDTTMAVERLGELPVPDFTTRVIRPDELEPAPPPAPAPVAPPLPPSPPPPPAAVVPPPLPAAAPPQITAPPQAAKPRRQPGHGGRIALLVGVPVALLLVVAGAVAWLSRRGTQPAPPQQTQKQVQAPAPAPVAPQPLPVAPATEAPPAEVATPLVPGQPWDETLARGLRTGDLALLKSAVAAPPAAATLTPAQKKDLARARKILDLDGKLTKAQRAKKPPEILRQAGLLLAELPGNARAGQARTQAADALLAEADAQAAQARFDEALEALEQLRAGWKDHPGLAERLERVRAEKRSDDQMEEALAAATKAERAERPRDGLEALDQVRPNERYAERFRQTRERLQSQLAQLDRNPPQIALNGPAEPSYEKGATVTIALRITDDQAVASATAWARPEGGRFTQVPLRQTAGGYEIEIGPDFHQNKTIDFYVTATDGSGHTGALGSVQRPQKIKRKKWISKILGGKDEG